MLGYTLGLVNQNMEKQAASMPNKPPTMSGGSFSGPPKVLALNLAVFSAVQSGLTLAVKKYRGVEGNDDIPSNMAGMFGAGISLSLCTNLVGDAPAAPGQTKPTTPAEYATDAIRTGALFAGLNGAFMKVGQWFTGKNQTTDVYYYHTNGMLAALGLEKYEKNFKRGLLTDDTLALLSDSALKEIKIPPRPAAEDPQLRRGEQETHGRVRAAARRVRCARTGSRARPDARVRGRGASGARGRVASSERFREARVAKQCDENTKPF